MTADTEELSSSTVRWFYIVSVALLAFSAWIVLYALHTHTRVVIAARDGSSLSPTEGFGNALIMFCLGLVGFWVGRDKARELRGRGKR